MCYENSTWWHFTRKATNVHVNTPLHFFVDLEVKLRLIYVVAFHQKGLIFPLKATSLQLFCGAVVNVRKNLRGDISPERPEM